MNSDASDDEQVDPQNSKKSLYYQGKEGLIFLIDASPGMFNDDGGDDDGSPFHKAIKCAKICIANKAISGSSDLIGIVLFGTKKSDNPQDLKNIVVVDVLKPPSADYILDINNKWLALNATQFESKYGHDDGFCLGDAFWVCNSMFTSSRKKFFSKKILLFTNTEDPHPNNKSYRNQSLSRAQDLKDWDIEIELVPMKKPFNLDKFYFDIVSDPLSHDDNMETKLEDLMAKVRAKSHKQRVLTTLPVYLSPGIKFTVSLYALIRETKKPSSVVIRKQDNELLKRETQWVLGEDEIPLDGENFRKAVVIADEIVVMEQDDIPSLAAKEVGFKLLGFKPKSVIEPYYHMKPGYYLYPDEKSVKGSTRLYNALLTKCLERKVVAFVKATLRKTSSPRLMALYPVDDEFLQGFYVLILPFAEDMRGIEANASSFSCVDDTLKGIAKEIIEKCTKDYTPDMIKNPALQTFWSHLEALALNSSEADAVVDSTDPSLYINDKELKNLAHEFHQRLPKGKEQLDLREAYEKGTLDKHTVPVLKAFVLDNNIKCTGTRKGELIQAITKHFRNK